MKAILLWVLAYLIGSIPVGVLVAAILGSNDPRSQGSGNIGATNVARTSGKKAGLMTLAGDCGKGILALLIAIWSGAGEWIVAITALAVFSGHLYPVFLGFKGGKGVATALGIFLVLTPLAVLIEIFLFALIVGWSRFVSLGSMIAAATLPAFICLLGYNRSIVLMALIISALTIFRHKNNIIRLSQGQENRL